MRKQRLLSLFLCLLVCLGVFAPAASAQEASSIYTVEFFPQDVQTVNADILIASNSVLEANTNLSTDTTTKTEGSFRFAELPKQANMIVQNSMPGMPTVSVGIPDLPFGTYSDDIPLEPLEESPLFAQKAASYSEGDTKTFQARKKTSDSATEDLTMQCLYIGQHCTIWNQTDTPDALKLTRDHAKLLADYFDDHFDAMAEAFGSSWKDPDGDGKLAVMCYDIDHQYPTQPGSYTAGYFLSGDLNSPNDLDCIHIDTFPAMGGLSNCLGNIPNVYSTLFHEFQHLINYSYRLNVTPKLKPMPTFLNEAFSLATEHLICGSDSVKSRVQDFNGYSTGGYPLTFWDNGNSLPNYANSYLFGQYIRIRYGQLHGTDGNEFYKLVYQSRASMESNGDTLKLIADLLGTTKQQLVMDFWAAVRCKDPTGIYGFGGERWADSIQSKGTVLSATSGIYNGGMRYYGTLGEYALEEVNNMVFAGLNAVGKRDRAGNDLYWEIYNNDPNTLILTGSGDLTSATWQSRAAQIETVILPKTVTSICANAFALCENLETVLYDGSLSDWNALRKNIGKGNEPLVNASFRFGTTTSPDGAICVGAEKEKEKDGTTVSLSFDIKTQETGQGKVCAVQYVNGKMTGLKTLAVDLSEASGEAEFTDDGGAVYKIMLVDTDFAPVCMAWQS